LNRGGDGCARGRTPCSPAFLGQLYRAAVIGYRVVTRRLLPQVRPRANPLRRPRSRRGSSHGRGKY
jgi:hypothetical protein